MATARTNLSAEALHAFGVLAALEEENGGEGVPNGLLPVATLLVGHQQDVERAAIQTAFQAAKRVVGFDENGDPITMAKAILSKWRARQAKAGQVT